MRSSLLPTVVAGCLAALGQCQEAPKRSQLEAALAAELRPGLTRGLGDAKAASGPVFVFPFRLDHQKDAGGELEQLHPELPLNRASRAITEIVLEQVRATFGGGDVLGPEDLEPVLAGKSLQPGHFRGAGEATRYGAECGASRVVFGCYYRERTSGAPNLVLELVIADPRKSGRPQSVRVPLISYGGRKFAQDAVTSEYEVWQRTDVPLEAGVDLWGRAAAAELLRSGPVARAGSTAPRLLVLVSEGTSHRYTALAEKVQTSLCEAFARQTISFVNEPHDALRQAGYELADVLRLLDCVHAKADRGALTNACADVCANVLVHVLLDVKQNGVVTARSEILAPREGDQAAPAVPLLLPELQPGDVRDLLGKAPEVAPRAVSGEAALLAALRNAARNLTRDVAARPELGKRLREAKIALGPILTKQHDEARLLLANLGETLARELAVREKAARARLGDGAKLDDVYRAALAEMQPVAWNGTQFPNLLALAAFRAQRSLELVVRASPFESARKSALRTTLIEAGKTRSAGEAPFRADNLILDRVLADLCDDQRTAALEHITTFGMALSVDASRLIADVLVGDLMVVFKLEQPSDAEVVATALVVEITTQKCLAEASAPVFARHCAVAAAALEGDRLARPSLVMTPATPPVVNAASNGGFGPEQRKFLATRVPLIYCLWRKGDQIAAASGSGFALRIGGKNRIVTNRHVVLDEGRGLATELFVAFPSGEFFPTRLVQLSTSSDLAVLEDSRARPDVLEMARSAELDQPVRLAGYPGLVAEAAAAQHWSKAPASCKDILDPFVLIVTEGKVLRIGEPEAGNARFHRVLSDLASWGGNSGGPLLNQALEVVAVHHAGSTVAVKQSSSGGRGYDQSKVAYGLVLAEHMPVLEALSAGRRE